MDAGEAAKFGALAAEWWNPKGKFGVLHVFNPVRLDYIKAASAPTPPGLAERFHSTPLGMRRSAIAGTRASTGNTHVSSHV